MPTQNLAPRHSPDTVRPQSLCLSYGFVVDLADTTRRNIVVCIALPNLALAILPKPLAFAAFHAANSHRRADSAGRLKEMTNDPIRP